MLRHQIAALTIAGAATFASLAGLASIAVKPLEPPVAEVAALQSAPAAQPVVMEEIVVRAARPAA